MRVELRLDFDAIAARVDEVTPDMLARAAEHVREVAVERTPLEEGTLRRSAKVVVDGDEVSVTYDGPYARYQHERLELRHEVGQAKYLESATQTEADTVMGIIAAEVERAQGQ